jgi:hypothetical protein
MKLVRFYFYTKHLFFQTLYVYGKYHILDDGITYCGRQDNPHRSKQEENFSQHIEEYVNDVCKGTVEDHPICLICLKKYKKLNNL